MICFVVKIKIMKWTNGWIKLKQIFLTTKIAISNFFHYSTHHKIQANLRKTTIFNIIPTHQWVIIIFHFLLWLLTLVIGILSQIFPNETNQIFNVQMTIWLTFVWTTLVLIYFIYNCAYRYLQLRDQDLFVDRFSKRQFFGPKINAKIKRQVRNQQLIKSVFGQSDVDDGFVASSDPVNRPNH